MSDRYQLLGAEVSYYTGKVRAYLRYKEIPFDEVLATRDVYKNVILPRVGWAVIPVVITPEDETLQDTTEIIDALELRFPECTVYPETPRQRLASLLLEVYGDEWLGMPAMHYRWNYCYDWVVLEFGKVSAPERREAEQRAIGERNAERFHGYFPSLGIDDSTTRAIELSYEALLADLDRHFQQHPYLFGTRPSIGDFGLVGPLYAHLYRDPYPGELMRRTAPAVAAWVERMQDPVPRSGQFLSGDEVPDTLLPVLRRTADEQLPILLDTVEQTAAWLEKHPQQELPALFGSRPFTLLRGTADEVTAERAIRPFSQWMFQRPVDFYQGLGGEARASCDRLLRDMGAGDALAIQFPRRVRRDRFKLVGA